MAQRDGLLHAGAAQVDVPVLQAKQLVHLRAVGDLEWRGLRLVEHDGLGGGNLDLAGRERGVHRPLGAGVDGAAHLHDPFAAERLGGGVGLGRKLGVEDDLHQAVPVPQVDEDQPAVVPAIMHPAAEGYPSPA